MSEVLDPLPLNENEDDRADGGAKEVADSFAWINPIISGLREIAG